MKYTSKEPMFLSSSLYNINQETFAHFGGEYGSFGEYEASYKIKYVKIEHGSARVLRHQNDVWFWEFYNINGSKRGQKLLKQAPPKSVIDAYLDADRKYKVVYTLQYFTDRNCTHKGHEHHKTIARNITLEKLNNNFYNI